MVHCADIIKAFWAKVDQKKVGGEALVRLLVVYPWTQRYFDTFGNMGSADAICHNAKVQLHGEKVVCAIGEGFKHLDNLKAHFAQLSKYHSEKLHVDPANFRRFADVLVITLARHFHNDFTPEVQCAFEQGLRSISEALAKGYH